MNEYLESKSPAYIFVVGVILTSAVGVADYYLPPDVTLFALYLAAVLMVAWYAGGRAALTLGLISVAVWWMANAQLHRFSALAWRGCNRYVAFVVVSFGGAAMRAQRASMRERISFLEEKRRLEEEIVRAGEREQMRIGQDLHDGLCQHLAAIDCAFACLEQEVQEDAPSKGETGEFIHAQLKRAITEARSLAIGLFPVQVNEEGFVTAVSELVETSRHAYRVEIDFDAPVTFHVRDATIGLHLFRILQEALSNAIKHAKAGRIQVRLRETPAHLILTVSDDGVGFETERTVGMGRRTMRYRADAVGAILEVTSHCGQGTTVSCSIPQVAAKPLDLA